MICILIHSRPWLWAVSASLGEEALVLDTSATEAGTKPSLFQRDTRGAFCRGPSLLWWRCSWLAHCSVHLGTPVWIFTKVLQSLLCLFSVARGSLSPPGVTSLNSVSSVQPTPTATGSTAHTDVCSRTQVLQGTNYVWVHNLLLPLFSSWIFVKPLWQWDKDCDGQRKDMLRYSLEHNFILNKLYCIRSDYSVTKPMLFLPWYWV